MAALPTVTIATTDGTATEGVAGDGLTFTLTRTGDLSGSLTVNTYVYGGTLNPATSGQDYVLPPSTVTFQPGSATAVLNVSVIDDAIAETTEGVAAGIYSGDGYQRSGGFTGSSAEASIFDNDSGSTPLPTVTIATTDGTATEGVAGDGLTFTLTRTGDLSGSLTVNTYVYGGTLNPATSGQDYVLPPSTVTFQPGSATAVLNVSVIDDAIAETTEGVAAGIYSGDGYQRSGGFTGSSAEASIFDNDSGSTPLPTVTIATTDGTATEGVAGDGLTFTLTRTGDLSGSLTVNFSSSGGGAGYANGASPADYTPTQGILTFASGSSTAVLNIAVVDDTEQEPTEGVNIFVVSGTGYQVGEQGSVATGAITANDAVPTPLPTVTIATTDGTAAEGVPGDGLAFTLTRTGDLSGALTVNTFIGGGTPTPATSGQDFVAPPSTVTFQPGSATAVLNVSVIDDAIAETTEGVGVFLAPGDGYQRSSFGYAEASILDNDTLPPNVVGSAYSDTLVGDAGGNSLYGQGGDDSLYGLGGNDTLIGDAGNDFLYGGPGNDQLDGGSGFDTAFYSGARSNYTFSGSAANIISLADKRGIDGSDTISSVEFAWFSDGAIDFGLSSPNADEIYRVYQAVFDRQPDDGGLRYWTTVMDQGASLGQVAQGFIGSPEFIGNYGQNPTNAEYAQKLYTNVLDRAPDPGGLQWWVDRLNEGASKADVLVGFSESQENHVHTAPYTDHGFWVL